MDYTVRKINDYIWAFDEGNVRSFLVVGEQGALLIDTGCGVVDYPEEIMNITDLPVMLVNTHSDGDHTGSNNLFADDPCYAHPDEIPFLETEDLKFLPCGEGFVFDLGGVKLEVLHTPGHTPGSICLFERETGILFSGDTAGEASVWMFGDKRDIDKYIASLKRLEKLEGVKQVFCCHGELFIETPGLFGDLAALAESAKAGTSTYENEVLSWGDDSTTVKTHRAGRVSIHTF